VLTTLVIFHVVVLAALGIDLAFAGSGGHKRAAVWTGIWIALALGFGLWVRHTMGNAAFVAFITCYLVELSLSTDNIVVMLYIFSSRHVEERDQQRMLLLGVLGAVIMRGVFIVAGATLIQRLEWVTYVFAAILVWAGIRMAMGKPHRQRTTTIGSLSAFWTTVLLIESADVVFAVDSVPAAFAITRDPFLIYTSNILAVIGLRSLYTLIAGSVGRIRYLDRGLAAILIFVGLGLGLEPWIEIPPGATLGAVLVILGLTAALSARSLRRTDV
jgi:tellurite resistance protein TerC